MILARIILGFLAIEPMSGYDLLRAFRTSAAYFWNADKAQIYRTLARLVDDGFARTEIIPGTDAPDRVVHHLTDTGRDALTAWLVSDPNRQAERDEFIARIFFAEALDDAALLRLIDERREAAASALDALRAVQGDLPDFAPTEDRGAWLRAQTLSLGIRNHETHLAWLDELRAGVTEGAR